MTKPPAQTDLRRLIRLIEATMTVDRTTTAPPPPVDRRPRDKPSEPRGGLFWLRGQTLYRITGTSNEIVALSGQVVMQHPDAFGLTTDAIMAMLLPFGELQYSPAAEYRAFLRNPDVDLSHVALLYKSSNLVYQQMLKAGWAWVRYDPPEKIHFAMIPEVVKRQIASAAEHFSLLQIDQILVTVIKEFGGLHDRYPAVSRNKTLVFNKNEFKGFAGSFGGVLDWSQGKDAPAANYLYFAAIQPFTGVHAQQMNVKTPQGYRKRWGIRFHTDPATLKGEPIGRVPISLLYSINCYKHWNRGISTTGTMTTMYSDRPFNIRPDDVEFL